MASTVELFVNGAWLDVTTGGYVLADDPITITRGGDAQSNKTNPGSCTLTLYDRDKNGRWSNRVSGSPNFRKLGRNTPIRVSVDGDVRAVMEVPEWNPRWDTAEAKVTVPIQAAGILGRLTQGARSLRSPLCRSHLRANPVAYWPMEEDRDATEVASGLPRGAPMDQRNIVFTGGTAPFTFPELAKWDDLPGALRAPNFNGAYLRGPVSGGSDTGWHVEWDMKTTRAVGSPPSTATGFPVIKWTTGGTQQNWSIFLPIDDGSANFEVIVGAVGASSNDHALTVPFTAAEFNNRWHHYAVTAALAGSTTTARLYVDGVLRDTATLAASGTLGAIDAVRINPEAIGDQEVLGFGHVAVYNGTTPGDAADAATGYAGETAGRRFQRLCSEEGVAFTGVGDLDDTVAMGAQQIDTLVGLLQGCADADRGKMTETRTALGLTCHTRVSMYNQYGPLLDYTAQLIRPPLEPTEDVTFTHNDVTVERIGGGSRTSTLDTADGVYHTLTTQAPPDGVGTYDRGPVQLNLATDDQAQAIADWIRHLGTWDELRYPRLTVEFAAPAWAAESTLKAAVAALDVGSQLRLGGLPAWLPPDEVAMLVRASQETIYPDSRRTITWTLAPGWPWEVGVVDSGGSTLVKAVTAGSTTLKLDTSAGPPWSTLDEPYWIQLDGEAMKVTNMTIDFPGAPVAGTVVHGDNATVTPGLPAGLAEGDALFCLAVIRGTGAVPNTPSGYIPVVDSNNMRLSAKYAGAAETAPNVSFSGGAAGDTTSAVLLRSTGCSIRRDTFNERANASAQDIAYPGIVYERDRALELIVGWKADDWTSAAGLGGSFVELVDAFTVTGNDQGIVIDYALRGDGGGSDAAGSFVVTGGAAAVSRAFSVALRPLQTATVTRGINGTAITHAVGAAVHSWRAGVNGL